MYTETGVASTWSNMIPAGTKRVVCIVLVLFAVSSAGAALSFETPQDDDTISGQTQFNATNTSFEMDTANSVNMTQNGTLIGENDNLRGNIANITNDTTTWDGDGLYTIKAKAWNSSGQIANATINVTVDNTPPSFSLNAPQDDNISGNETVNLSITDAGIGVDDAMAEIAIQSGGENRTVQNDTGWSSLSAGSYYTAEINTSAFDDGEYRIWVRANDTLGNRNVTSYNKTFDNTAPDIDSFQINETTGTTTDEIVRVSEVNLTVSATDSTGAVDSCRVDVVSEQEWNDGSYGSSNVLTIPTNDWFNNDSADLSGHQGNFTFNAVCNDTAGNKASLNNITTSNDNERKWFPFDAAGPQVDVTTVSPGNDTWTDNTSPTIEFGLTDYTGINQSSVTIGFNGSTYNETNSSMSLSFASNNTTTSVSFDLSSLSDDEYDLTVNGTEYDHGGPVRNGTDRVDFNIDTEPPSVSYDLDGTDLDRDGTTWYDEEVDVDVSCTDTDAPVDQHEVTADDGSGGTSSGSAITFTGEDETEQTYDLTISCTDEAGNENETSASVAIDNRDPRIERTPAPGALLSRTFSTSVDIDIELIDEGVGFDEDDMNTWIDVTFEGDSAGEDGALSGDQSSYTIDWSETIDAPGAYEVGLDDGSVTVEDRFGNQLSVGSWTFEVEEGDAYTEGDLVFSDEPETVAIGRDADTSTTVTLENNGNESVDFSISASTDTDAVSASIDEDSVDLDAGDETDVEISLSATDFEEPGVLTVEAESDDELVSTTINLEPDLDPFSLSLYDVPNSIELIQGKSTWFEMIVENSGDEIIENGSVSLSHLDVTADPSSPAFGDESNTTINVTVSAGPNESVNVHDITMTVGNDATSVDQEIEAKVQPASEQAREEIETDYQRLKNDLDNATLEEQLTEAQTAMDGGDYARAQQIIIDVQSQQEGLGTADVGLENDGRSPLMTALMALIGIAAIVFVFMLYRTISDESDTENSGSDFEIGQEASSYAEKIGTLFYATTSKVFEDLNDIKNSITAALEEEEEDSEETRRKRIRFDDA